MKIELDLTQREADALVRARIEPGYVGHWDGRDCVARELQGVEIKVRNAIDRASRS